MKKVNINKILDEIVSLQNQVDGLEMLISAKKSIVAAFFDSTGEKSISNNECTVYLQEKVKVDYDIKKLKSKLDSKIYNEIVDNEYKIEDFDKFKKIIKEYKIPVSEVKSLISTKNTINDKAIKELYKSGDLNLQQIDGCYTAKVTKSIAVRMKHTGKSLPVKEND